ncbi:hypothetical protein ZWY2020_052697 [Hordeum vulgare]|nr:hypothetical protein ZWY2020_052697 [Hordeum vulgare]
MKSWMSTASSESAAIQEHLPSSSKLRRDTLLYLTAGNAALLPTFARIRRGGLPAKRSPRRIARQQQPLITVALNRMFPSKETSLNGEKGLRTREIQRFERPCKHDVVPQLLQQYEHAVDEVGRGGGAT